jgi:uncharacterized membrane protein
VTRMLLARVLVVLAALFAVLALIAGYIRWQALDNDTFRGTATDLIADDEVRNQIALTLVDELYANFDVAGELEARLPEDQQRLAPLIAAGLRELADRAAVRILERPRAQELWVASLARAHEQLLRLLDDDLTTVSTQEGVLVLNLRPLVIQLGEQVAVVGSLATRLPEDAGVVEIMPADRLERAQDLTQLLKVLGSFLWIVPLALAGVAIWLARDRKRAIVRMLALASLATGLIVLVVAGMAGRYITDELVQNPTVRPAAKDAWVILASQLVDGGRTLIGIGVVLLLGVWFAGPTRSGSAVRARLSPHLARAEIVYGLAAAAYLALLWWGPTVQTRRAAGVVGFAVLFAVGAEAIRRVAAREPVPEPAPEAAPAQPVAQSSA